MNNDLDRHQNLEVSNRRSRFATIRIAIGSQRFEIARFEPQPQNPFESLLSLYYFFTCLGVF